MVTARLSFFPALLLAAGATAQKSMTTAYTNPHATGGCADGEAAVQFSFGGSTCAPACDPARSEHGHLCPPDPAESKIVHPICMLAVGATGAASGNPEPTHCALHCTPSSICPSGASCKMPEEVCAYPLPTGMGGDTVLTTMGLTRAPTELERLYAHDDNGH